MGSNLLLFLKMNFDPDISPGSTLFFHSIYPPLLICTLDCTFTEKGLDSLQSIPLLAMLKLLHGAGYHG